MQLPMNHGGPIPVLGLGVYQSAPGQETQDAVRWALELGYRHIDTARFYRNEVDVGVAVRSSGVPRSEVFVTTKLANHHQGYESTLVACEDSLRRSGLDYFDLCLIHWPVPGARLESYRALERLHQEGRCRAIGVSNFTVRHLDELLKVATIVPAVNQIEVSPFLPATEIVERCRAAGIVVEAYSPLTQGRRLGDPTVVATAKKHDRTPAQVLLRWAVQKGHVVLPKSVRRERIAENARIFDFTLDPADLSALDALADGFRTCWDPTQVP